MRFLFLSMSLYCDIFFNYMYSLYIVYLFLSLSLRCSLSLSLLLSLSLFCSLSLSLSLSLFLYLSISLSFSLSLLLPQVISLDPGNTHAYHNRGISLDKLGSFDVAIKDFSTVRKHLLFCSVLNLAYDMNHNCGDHSGALSLLSSHFIISFLPILFYFIQCRCLSWNQSSSRQIA